MPTAVEVNELVERFAPLAAMLARTFARSRPHLRQDFESDASFACFRVLASPTASKLGANLGALVRVAVTRALIDRVRREKLRAAVRLHADGTGDERDLLALIPGREHEPGAELEAAEELAALVRRGGLTKAQRAKVERLKAR